MTRDLHWWGRVSLFSSSVLWTAIMTLFAGLKLSWNWLKNTAPIELLWEKKLFRLKKSRTNQIWDKPNRAYIGLDVTLPLGEKERKKRLTDLLQFERWGPAGRHTFNNSFAECMIDRGKGTNSINQYERTPTDGFHGRMWWRRSCTVQSPSS